MNIKLRGPDLVQYSIALGDGRAREEYRLRLNISADFSNDDDDGEFSEKLLEASMRAVRIMKACKENGALGLVSELNEKIEGVTDSAA
jgi:hypothetical protein